MLMDWMYGTKQREQQNAHSWQIKKMQVNKIQKDKHEQGQAGTI